MKIKNYLVIRLSSMGDVALAVPVVKAVISQNEHIKLFILTNKSYQIFFKSIKNLVFVGIDVKGKHKGLLGLLKLAYQIDKMVNLDGVIDIHGVLRSHILSLYFQLRGIKVAKICKERRAKRLIIKRKQIKQLKHTGQRYAEVFQHFMKIDLNNFQFIPLSFQLKPSTFQSLKPDYKHIGVAPFAAFETKTYPLTLMQIVIKRFLKLGKTQIFIFGGGAKDQEKIKRLLNFDCKNLVVNRVKNFDLEDQMALIAQMQVMLTMDSANMHLANLVGTKVVSIWGPTHHFFGFTSFTQDKNNKMLQVDIETLKCRPCSFFGKKTCINQEQYCFTRIPISKIVDSIKELIC